MKLNEKGLPLYYQIEKYMREKILGNEWPVGTQIPTETELMELFSVSRATLRQAVGNLCNEGLLERLQGRGTFVKTKAPYIGDYTQVWLEQDARHVQETLSFEDRQGSSIRHLCDSMGISSDSVLVSIKCLHSNIDARSVEPSNVTISYFPKDRFPDIKDRFSDEYSIYHLMEKHYNIHLRSALSVFNAVCLEEQLSRLLELPSGTPVICIEKTLFDEMEQPVYISEIYLHPSNNRLEFRSQS
ncbi:MAG: GntR family transcriptional regulator [Lawsonibacter sp.]|jgi:GntR family transcriptional regulator|nr:GntR family transcriptional regulator [Lawsonibacter sp.]